MGGHSNGPKFDLEKFSLTHRGSDLLPNPEAAVAKLLDKLLAIYMKVFDSKIFDEDTQRIKMQDAIPALKEEMRELRETEHRKLTSRQISFLQVLDNEAAREEMETIKRCFWINLFNFKIL